MFVLSGAWRLFPLLLKMNDVKWKTSSQVFCCCCCLLLIWDQSLFIFATPVAVACIHHDGDECELYVIMLCCFCCRPQPMFSVTPSLATNVNAAAAAAAAFNPYLGPVSPGLMPADILPSTPVLVTSNPSIPVPHAAAQKLMRTDRLEVGNTAQSPPFLSGSDPWP